MHSAPAVSFPVGRSHFQGWIVGVAALTGTVAGAIWHAQIDLAAWRQWLFAVTLLLVCVVAARAWYRTPQGRLRWDGQEWSWITQEVTHSGVLAVHLDLQFFLLLSWRSKTGARTWLWPERRLAPTSWSALRRAVFSHAADTLTQVKS